MNEHEYDLIMAAIADIKKDTSKMVDCIYGNGKPGLLVEVDRLKVSQANRSRLQWIIIGALAVLIIGSAYNFILNQSAMAGINKIKQTQTTESNCNK